MQESCFQSRRAKPEFEYVSHEAILEKLYKVLLPIGLNRQKIKTVLKAYSKILQHSLASLHPVKIAGVGWILLKLKPRHKSHQEWAEPRDTFRIRPCIFLSWRDKECIRELINRYYVVNDDATVNSKIEIDSL